jgi:hypothetical protein
LTGGFQYGLRGAVDCTPDGSRGSFFHTNLMPGDALMDLRRLERIATVVRSTTGTISEWVAPDFSNRGWNGSGGASVAAAAFTTLPPAATTGDPLPVQGHRAARPLVPGRSPTGRRQATRPPEAMRKIVIGN